MDQKKRVDGIRNLIGFVLVWLLTPLTIYGGIVYFNDRKYYFISLLLMIYALLAFLLRFEKREPKMRELMVVAVLVALGVAGRAAFYMIPQFKPVLAVAIIAGVGLDKRAGFLVGVLIAFISNFFFGQGPWQMFGMGLVGLLAGIAFKPGRLPQKRLYLAIFGFLVAIFVYGGLMNPASVLMFQATATVEALIGSYLLGLPFDLILGLATFIFLFLFGEVMLEKIARIKIKYGLL